MIGGSFESEEEEEEEGEEGEEDRSFESDFAQLGFSVLTRRRRPFAMKLGGEDAKRWADGEVTQVTAELLGR